jgi:hypothetical protein
VRYQLSGLLFRILVQQQQQQQQQQQRTHKNSNISLLSLGPHDSEIFTYELTETRVSGSAIICTRFEYHLKTLYPKRVGSVGF